MYYNIILQLIAGLTNVVGTAYAVLSILKATPTDLYKSITLKGMGDNDKSLLTQKKSSKNGNKFDCISLGNASGILFFQSWIAELVYN